MQEKKLVYAVDDEESIRDVYKFALSGAGFETECFSCADELYSALKDRLPDIFLLDIMLDGEDGYSILEELRKGAKTRDIPVIMVSAKGNEIDKVKGLDLGADDYVSKPFGVLELIARINAKLRVKKPDGSLFCYNDVTVNDKIRTITVNGKPVSATLKQYELLKLLVKNAGTVLTRDFLLDNVWGENYGETRTLDIHVAELRKLLSESQATIITVRGVGYSLKQKDEKQDRTF